MKIDEKIEFFFGIVRTTLVSLMLDDILDDVQF